jgi:hypothetical protein
MTPSLISTPQIQALHQEITSLTESSVTHQDIITASKQQRRRELKLLDTATICPVPQVRTFQDRLPGLKESRLQKLVTQEFYNADVMATALCVTDAVIYTQPVQMGSVTSLMRIRHWIENLHGSPNDLKANLGRARDFFAVKTALESSGIDLVHELSVGLFGTNRLRVTVPNFAYIYGGFECSPPIITDKRVVTWCQATKNPVNYLLYENVFPGSLTLAEYVRTCTVSQFLDKYFQILYALRYAAQEIDFTHYHLTADRVILRPLDPRDASTSSGPPGPFKLSYLTERGLEYVSTDYVATMIDFSWSHFNYNGEAFGNYQHLNKFVYPRRSFPLTDAYKLLCTSLVEMQNHGNRTTFDDLTSILEFFSSESPQQILQHQASFDFGLPLTPELASKTLDDLARYIRSTQACSFITPNPGNQPILGCQGTSFCVTVEGMTRLIGLDKPATPETVFDFYEMGTRSLSQGKTLDSLKRDFPYEAAVSSAKTKLGQLFMSISKEISATRQIDLNLLPLTEIFTWTTLEAYRHYLLQVAAIYDQLESANIQITVLKFTAEAYQDTNTLDLVEERYRQLLNLMIPLNGFLSGLRDDRQHLEAILDNPVNQKFIDETLQRDPRLNWYWNGRPIFDYMLVT